MNEGCQRYAENPEANATHLQECAKCRALYAPIESHSVQIGELPLAPWEAAGYRAWPLVFGGALALLAIAFALCAAAGISFLTAIRAGARFDWRALLETAGQALRPLGPVGFGVLFVVVNTALILLLRRTPRGIDA